MNTSNSKIDQKHLRHEFTSFCETQSSTKVNLLIAAGDINGDGITEILTGAGPGFMNNSLVKIFSPDGTELTGFLAYPDNIRFGVKISAGNV